MLSSIHGSIIGFTFVGFSFQSQDKYQSSVEFPTFFSEDLSAHKTKFADPLIR